MCGNRFQTYPEEPALLSRVARNELENKLGGEFGWATIGRTRGATEKTSSARREHQPTSWSRHRRPASMVWRTCRTDQPGSATHVPVRNLDREHRFSRLGHRVGFAEALVRSSTENEGFANRSILRRPIDDELLGTKVYYIRAGAFKDVDVCLSVSYGPTPGDGALTTECQSASAPI